MREYSLRFQDGSTSNWKNITFESEDAHEAFSIVERDKLSGPVEIQDGHRSLGTITRASEGGWILKCRENPAKSLC